MYSVRFPSLTRRTEPSANRWNGHSWRNSLLTPMRQWTALSMPCWQGFRSIPGFLLTFSSGGLTFMSICRGVWASSSSPGCVCPGFASFSISSISCIRFSNNSACLFCFFFNFFFLFFDILSAYTEASSEMGCNILYFNKFKMHQGLIFLRAEVAVCDENAGDSSSPR